MRTVLVTGASGFVGGHVVEALASSGIRPRCLVRPGSRLAFIRDGSPELVSGDVTSLASLESAVEGVDGIVHCAGVTRARSPAEYMQVNGEGCRNLYRACLARNPDVRRIVHISSLAAFGPSVAGQPVREDQARRPVSHYGESKLAGQRIAEAHMDRLPIVILVPPAVYGPWDRAFLGLFACAKWRVSPVIGREARWVSLLYATDLAGAVLATLADARATGATFLLDDGRAHTWSEFMTTISRCMRTSPVRVRIPIRLARGIFTGFGLVARCAGRPTVFARDRLQDYLQPSWTCSSAKIRTELNFSSRYTLEQGVLETCGWYRTHHWL